MKIEQLDYIQAIVDSDMSVSLAANIVGKSQPTLSKEIMAFEKEFGTAVFHRNGKSISGLTKAGELILTYISNINRDLENIVNVGQEYANSEKGEIKIAAISPITNRLLPEILSDFQVNHTHIRYQLFEEDNHNAIELLKTNEVDIAVVANYQTNHPTLTQLPVLQSPWALLMPDDHPMSDGVITIESLATYPLICYQQKQLTHKALNKSFGVKSLKPNVVMTATSIESIENAVMQGLGIAMIPQWLGHSTRVGHSKIKNSTEMHTIICRSIEHLFTLPINVSVVIRRDVRHRQFIYKFIEMLAPHLTEDMLCKALKCLDDVDVENLFKYVDIPER